MTTPDSSSSRSRIRLRSSAASFVRSAVRARQWLRQAIWLWPLLAALVLGTIGFFVRQAMERSITNDIASELATLRDAEVAALRLWMKTQETIAASMASDPTAGRLAQRLIEMANEPGMTQATILGSKELAALRAELEPILKQHGYMDMLVADTNLVFAAACEAN